MLAAETSAAKEDFQLAKSPIVSTVDQRWLRQRVSQNATYALRSAFVSIAVAAVVQALVPSLPVDYTLTCPEFLWNAAGFLLSAVMVVNAGFHIYNKLVYIVMKQRQPRYPGTHTFSAGDTQKAGSPGRQSSPAKDLTPCRKLDIPPRLPRNSSCSINNTSLNSSLDSTDISSSSYLHHRSTPVSPWSRTSSFSGDASLSLEPSHSPDPSPFIIGRSPQGGGAGGMRFESSPGGSWPTLEGQLLGPYQTAVKSYPGPESLEEKFGVSVHYSEIMVKFGLKSEQIHSWLKNIRQWFSITILARLVKNIFEVNEKMTALGYDLQIGQTSLHTLWKFVESKPDAIPELRMIVPYLDITQFQAYLCSRLKDLSSGECIRLYRGDSGAPHGGRPWSPDLPSDAQILFHLFCTYMDLTIPPNPAYGDFRAFSGPHILRHPAKPDAHSGIRIYQVSDTPPCFKVTSGEEVFDITKDINNLFLVICVFLHLIKVQENAHIGRVSLSSAGLNLLWVLEH